MQEPTKIVSKNSKVNWCNNYCPEPTNKPINFDGNAGWRWWKNAYLGVFAIFIAYDLSLLEVQYSGQDFRSLSLGCKNSQFCSIFFGNISIPKTSSHLEDSGRKTKGINQSSPITSFFVKSFNSNIPLSKVRAYNNVSDN
jgi:hypothetical protein